MYLERAVGKNEKSESFKLESLKLESFFLSCKEPSEVGNNPAKLERTNRSWKVSFEVEKYRWSWKVSLKLISLAYESFAEVGFAEVGNFSSNFPTSPLTLQLRHEHSNFGSNFQTSIFPISFWTFKLNTFQLLVLSNCPFELYVSLQIRDLRARSFWPILGRG